MLPAGFEYMDVRLFVAVGDAGAGDGGGEVRGLPLFWG